MPVKSSTVSMGYKLPTSQELSLSPSSGSVVTRMVPETSVIFDTVDDPIRFLRR
jgi:hypothetical protein